MTRPFLNQADPEWAGERCGRSRKKTIRNCGCLLTDLAQALRDLDIDPHATPLSVQRAALELWAARGSPEASAPFVRDSAAAFSERVGAANGLLVGPRVNRIQGGVMWETLVGALKSGGRVLMHVDETPDNKKDDPVHWVLAEQLDGVVVHYSDPDGGLAGSMPLVDLEGKGPGGKLYMVSGIRTVTRASVS